MINVIIVCNEEEDDFTNNNLERTVKTCKQKYYEGDGKELCFIRIWIKKMF